MASAYPTQDYNFLPNLTDSELATINNIGGGSGLPNGPSPLLDSLQLTSWANINASGGAEQYTNQAMWKQFISGPAYQARYGIQLTQGNYRDAARKESQRLFDLGFIQVHEVDNARLIFESYGRAANESFSYFPVTEETANAYDRVADMYTWDYQIGQTLEGLGDVTRNVGDKLEDLGEVVTNPLTLPAIAVVGIVAALFLLR